MPIKSQPDSTAESRDDNTDEPTEETEPAIPPAYESSDSCTSVSSDESPDISAHKLALKRLWKNGSANIASSDRPVKISSTGQTDVENVPLQKSPASIGFLEKPTLQKSGGTGADQYERKIDTTERRALWHEAISEYICRYENDIQTYEVLAEIVAGICKDLVKPIVAEFQVSARIKKIDSLRQKATDLAVALVEKQTGPTTKAEAIAHLEGQIADCAGVRILVYFPSHVDQVKKAFEKAETLVLKEFKISYSRRRTLISSDEFQRNFQREYSSGLFVSQEKNGPHEGRDSRRSQTWNQPGYRAVHLHVGLKMSDDTDGNSAVLSARLAKTGAQLSHLTTKLAEVQITSMPMHLWAQIEHDIIYKNPDEVLNTDSMGRMLDAINGLAITTEILQDELQRSLDNAKHEEQMTDEMPFKDEWELQSWLVDTFIRKTDPLFQKWSEFTEDIRFLKVAFDSTNEPATRSLIKRLVEEKNILLHEPRGSEALNIRALLLREFALKKSWEDDFEVTMAAPKYLRKALLVASAFSIMVALMEKEAIESFKERYPDDIEIMRKINTIFALAQFKYREDVDELNVFTDRFLSDNWCNLHDTSLALARLGFFPLYYNPSNIYDETDNSSNENLTDMSDPQFLEQYGELLPFVFTFRYPSPSESKSISLSNHFFEIPRMLEVSGRNTFDVFTYETLPTIYSTKVEECCSFAHHFSAESIACFFFTLKAQMIRKGCFSNKK